ncbi:choice-of-anchor J domain-containing protein [uncultured Muribaculum sp.]|uniref:choice-of-anchor J domain-containing protein n=1 Tax=uncultured Muribaculum sp. TaxID=1918613 RepID=UPI0025D7AFCF|nr:choice-of-anchor J domain-containing protein [uncultured Muribaculum sp.]
MNLTLRLSAVAIATVIMTCGMQAAEKRFYASVYSSNEWKEYPRLSEIGMYSFGLDTPDRQLVKSDSDIDAGGGGVMTEDFYFCTKESTDYGFTEVTHFTFKPDTWEYNSQLFGGVHGVATDLAYDHTTAKIYGCFYTDPDMGETAGKYVFGTINEATGERRAIKEIDTPWIALGCTRSGQLYSVGMDGTLWKVDKTKGDTEKMADLGFTANRRSTGAIDTSTGIFYVVVTNEDSSTLDDYGYSVSKSELYAVDLSTTTATLAYEFADGEAIGGMYIPGPLADDNAPAAPSGMTLKFNGGALDGIVSFTMPDKTFGGSTLEGEIDYLVRANGSLFARGTAAPGEQIEAKGKVDEDGQYEFVLELTNKAGRGPKAKASQWIGHDTPVKLTSAGLSYADGAFTLTWAHPTATEHGGYMDASMLTYDVTRLPDNVQVASATTATSLIDAVAIPEQMTGYSYRIDMSYRGKMVSTYTTPAYRLGSVSLPYVLDFDKEDSFADLTIIDVNGDRNEWYREEYWYIEALDLECTAAMYPYSSTNKADDWMILPSLSFEGGVAYTISFQVSTASESCPERLAVYYGTAPVPSALTTPILAEKEYAIYDPVDESITFTPTADGLYHIGFHACSEADGAGLALRNITVDSAASSAIDSIPAAPALSNRTVEVYNLQGVRVDSDVRGGMFIEVRADGSTRKILRP